MKKFRVTTDLDFNFYFVHKRFLKFWWVKYALYKSNSSTSHYGVYKIMLDGNYIFTRGEYGTYYYIVDTKERCAIDYYDSAEDYLDENSEHFI